MGEVISGSYPAPRTIAELIEALEVVVEDEVDDE
jgi:hypothetical protein